MIYFSLRQTHFNHVDASLLAEIEKLNNMAGPSSDSSSNDRVRFWVDAVSGDDELHAVAMPAAGGAIVASKNMAAYSPLFRDISPTLEPRFDELHLPSIGHVRRLVVRQDIGGKVYDILLLANLHHVDEEMRDVLTAIAFTVPLTLVLAAALAYLLAWKALAPVDQLRKRTDEIRAEHLDRRLPVINPSDELGQLTQTINAMIGRLETSFREVHRFTGDASHELRTPLSIIQSEAELGIEEAHGCEPAQERFSSILEECSRLAWMTDQLLTLSREDAGVRQHHGVPVDLVRLVREVTEALQPLVTARDLVMELHLQEPALVEGDAGRLRQVFYNLLDNALKFTPSGGKIEIQLNLESAGIAIEVRDTGQGIAPEHLARVFDRFYRVEKGSNSREGVGLGLSIVKSIVAAHSGQIEVQSQLGHGTSFRITLPNFSDESISLEPF